MKKTLAKLHNAINRNALKNYRQAKQPVGALSYSDQVAILAAQSKREKRQLRNLANKKSNIVGV